MYYKLAVFPFHFWTPDVYQGASNETAGLIASLPKIGAVAVLVRLRLAGDAAARHDRAAPVRASRSAPCSSATCSRWVRRTSNACSDSPASPMPATRWSASSPSAAGFAAAIYYITGYLLMVLACFTVIGQVSRDGANVTISGLAGLHKRSPLLATTLAVGVFGLAGVPPFAGFMGKLALLKTALDQGQLALVILAVVNTAIAIYYYLQVIREVYFREPDADAPALRVDVATRVLCALLIIGTLWLGLAPGRILEAIAASLR
jgi:NADH-quinone oxidoreductase subunit N